MSMTPEPFGARGAVTQRFFGLTVPVRGNHFPRRTTPS
ncbi:hypothetical protein GFS60_03265 [Rhodococcus sp. WAY2]|nr:hypothetical protein GFS60_03265 [Rhodococcus sp. WAY2]